MKNLIRRLPTKITCFFLCIITLCLSGVGAVGGIFMANEEFYTKTADEIFGDEIESELLQFSRIAVNYLANGKEIPSNLTDGRKTNLRYSIYKPNHVLKDTNMVTGGEGINFKNGRTYAFTLYVTEYDGGVYVDTQPINSEKSERWYIMLGVTEELEANDTYSQYWELISAAHSVRYAVIPITAVSLFLFFVFFVILMCASGRRAGDSEAHGGALNHIPFDILLAVSFGIFLLGAMLIDELDRTLNNETTVALIALFCFVMVCIMLGLCVSIAARIKQRNLFKNTVIWRVACLIWRFIKWLWKHIKRFAKRVWEIVLNIPLIWRTVCLLAGIFLTDILIIVSASENSEGFAVFILTLKTVAIGFFALFSALYMRKLQKGGEALAKGDLAYTVDTENMYYDFKKHGESLNRISAGMSIAVEERLHSERMKTELITNVSHDIKTPLTSIINYAGLISEQACENEKHIEYSEVLVRKSKHLKRLLDDLVEISKANSGTLDVALLPCDATVLLTQAAGEFEQKCADANLELITSIPEKSVRIMADSRRIWRVFENLMNNAVKYSLSNSRVYLSLEAGESQVKFIFKNTSRDSLNITPDELTERFVRGDSSRSSEGSGLGLSIAKSLTELQNGEMDIFIDGDLFKVVLTFPSV